MKGRSQTARVLGEAWEGFVDSMASASPRAQRRLVGGVFGSLVLLTLLAAGVAAWLSTRVGDGPLPYDPWFFERVEELISLAVAMWFSNFGSTALLAPLVVAVAILAARAGMGARAFIVVMSLLASKIVAKAAWVVWHRPRPGGVLDVLAPDKPSFPSGHVLQAVIIYGLLCAWWAGSSDSRGERLAVWGLAGFLVGITVLARIREGAHYASDCWASLILGVLWLVAVLWAERGFRGREA